MHNHTGSISIWRPSISVPLKTRGAWSWVINHNDGCMFTKRRKRVYIPDIYVYSAKGEKIARKLYACTTRCISYTTRRISYATEQLILAEYSKCMGSFFYNKANTLASWDIAFKDELGLVCIKAKHSMAAPLSLWRENIPK